jgi:L-amino acid N-acyltransferase YncA
MPAPLIRQATESDLAAINDIYNHYVPISTCTYQEELEKIESRREWYNRHGPRHPVTVAEIDGVVVGWASLSPYHTRSAYRFSVENSVYVRHDMQRRGIGAALLRDLIERARAIGHHTIVADIDAEQTGSIALHAKFGFEIIGRLKQVGFKFGKWRDVIYMQLML